MKLLLDTHIFLWMILNDPRLSAIAADLVTDPRNDLYLSPATYWELAIKVGAGKYQLPGPFEAFIERHIALGRLLVLPITVAHAAEAAAIPLHHRDPFDRMLIAQAIVERMPIVSADPAFDAYPVSRLW